MLFIRYPSITRLLCEDQTTKTDLDGAQDAIIDLVRDNGSAETSHSAILGDGKCNGQQRLVGFSRAAWFGSHGA
jgi:hypothetical protein